MKKLVFILMIGTGFTAFPQESMKTFDYNFRKGMEHYNKAVDIINAMDESEPQFDSIYEPEKMQFAIALRYLEKAYFINPKNERILRALQGIHFSLNEQEKSDKYKKELEALKKK